MLRSSALHKENWVSSSPHLHRGGLRVDVRFLSQAVSSCGSKRDLWSGVQYHCLAIITGFVANVYVGSSLISLYSNCTLVDNAYRVFEEMPVRNVVSWTAIIAGFAQEWQIDVCLELFHGMRTLALKPNDFTYTSLLSACTGSGALGHGRSAHCQVIHMGFHSYIHISNALIAMYCKCGSIQDAFYMFKKMDSKDVVSWNSMIAGIRPAWACSGSY
ncbi:Pentatricopeptide repeat-containing protein [Quillaja saponaria]|uniref:Pentatricopeptide repeat-containing protein n=1 Tax=Quillaja saponaria TaxID=32244 RepID=A0AAD7Q981_QUISA|nr:Pentatricopeptide repeat-containing protein [Quillaja saponaria]